MSFPFSFITTNNSTRKVPHSLQCSNAMVFLSYHKFKCKRQSQTDYNFLLYQGNLFLLSLSCFSQGFSYSDRKLTNTACVSAFILFNISRAYETHHFIFFINFKNNQTIYSVVFICKILSENHLTGLSMNWRVARISQYYFLSNFNLSFESW